GAPLRHAWSVRYDGSPRPASRSESSARCTRARVALLMDQPWWQKAVLYQVYVRSFADSTGDGVGDLRGVIDKHDCFSWLGMDGLWLSPVTVSPDKDWGYDVADYRDVQPVFGTLEDLDEL